MRVSISLPLACYLGMGCGQPARATVDDAVSPLHAVEILCIPARGEPSCKGLPPDLWCHAPNSPPPRRTSNDCPLASDLSFPVGCSVRLPSENPFMRGGGQPCTCVLPRGTDWFERIDGAAPEPALGLSALSHSSVHHHDLVSTSSER